MGSFFSCLQRALRESGNYQEPPNRPVENTSSGNNPSAPPATEQVGAAVTDNTGNPEKPLNDEAGRQEA